MSTLRVSPKRGSMIKLRPTHMCAGPELWADYFSISFTLRIMYRNGQTVYVLGLGYFRLSIPPYIEGVSALLHVSFNCSNLR